MSNISFTIPDDKISRVTDAMKGLFSIPKDENGDPLFTDNQWAKEAVKRFIIGQVQRYEQMIAAEEAKKQINPDSSIVE